MPRGIFRRTGDALSGFLLRPGSPTCVGVSEVSKAQQHDPGAVDFREIARKYSLQEHAARADQYFAALDVESRVARKPFASQLEAVELSSGVAAVLTHLHLFVGAKVLDFGAGTCWLSRVLALQECEVTAADVSANALRVGAELLRRDALADRLKINFATLDGTRLPFAERTFDRVICFDSLHHCADQKATIEEFFRVLKDDGIAAFHEPGPTHSRSSQSQMEMRNFGVIEGDIIVEDLIRHALNAGFSRAQLALYVSRPPAVDIGDFNQFLQSSEQGAAARELLATARREHENRRVFFLHKGNPIARLDSRSPVGLLADLSLEGRLTHTGVDIRGRAVNIGAATWLPSMQGPGSVNIGVHLYDAAGALVDNDYFRARLAQVPVPHGMECPVEFTVPFPAHVQRFGLVIDLVAEGVTWFEIGKSKVVRVEVDRPAGWARIADMPNR